MAHASINKSGTRLNLLDKQIHKYLPHWLRVWSEMPFLFELSTAISCETNDHLFKQQQQKNLYISLFCM